MSRRGGIQKREIIPDARYRDKLVARLISYMMLDGKKSVAEGIVCFSSVASFGHAFVPVLHIFVVITLFIRTFFVTNFSLVKACPNHLLVVKPAFS